MRSILVNPTDVDEVAEALGKVLWDRDLRRSLAEKGWKRAGVFSWRAGVEDIVRACVHLVESNSGEG